MRGKSACEIDPEGCEPDDPPYEFEGSKSLKSTVVDDNVDDNRADMKRYAAARIC